ncbi:MAG: DUF3781 domain-containing protein [Bacilli bacterium]|nr:DUF3781 domain-containing protein [Bacilli bacterium]
MNELFEHIDLIHTTKLGENRIRKNLDLEHQNVVSYCKKIVMKPNTCIIKRGKNYYCTLGNIQITIHSSSYTIITAHKKTPRCR